MKKVIVGFIAGALITSAIAVAAMGGRSSSAPVVNDAAPVAKPAVTTAAQKQAEAKAKAKTRAQKLAKMAKARQVVSGLTYSPKPLYDDDVSLEVSFSTSRAARPGYEWGVFVSALGKEPLFTCTVYAYSWDRSLGGDPNVHMRGAGKHHRSVDAVDSDDTSLLEPFCRGHLSVSIVEHKIGEEFEIGDPLSGDSSLESRVLGAP